MSEYDHERRIYTLTEAEARMFHTDKDRPEHPPAMRFYADKLEKFGFEIITVSESSLAVKGTPDEVWEALSGQMPFLA
jgi:hypothetical protein